MLTLGFRKLGLVCALSEMRAIPSKVYSRDDWVKQVKVCNTHLIEVIRAEFPIQATGLADLILRISHPGAFGEFELPVVEGSFRLYNWRDALHSLLYLWTPPSIPRSTEVNL